MGSMIIVIIKNQKPFEVNKYIKIWHFMKFWGNICNKAKKQKIEAKTVIKIKL